MSWTLGHYRVRGLELAYHAYGDPAAPPVLMIHGFLDHGQSFADVVAALPEPRYVIAPDLRGHGHSGWVGDGGYYHFYDYFDDVWALVEHLALPRFLLVGHSMGGSVAVGTAAILGPERVQAVLLLEGMGPPFQQLDASVERLTRWSASLRAPAMNVDVAARRAQRRPMVDRAEVADRLQKMNPRLPRDRAERLAETSTEVVPGGRVWRADPLHRTPAAKPYVYEEAAALWQALKMPVWSLYGEDAGWYPDRLSERHRAVPRLTPGVVPAAGHAVHQDQPGLVAQAIVALGQGEGLPPGIRPGEPVSD